MAGISYRVSKVNELFSCIHWKYKGFDMSTGVFRGDQIRTTFVTESLYADTFNLLRPSSWEPVVISSSYSLYGCGPFVNMRADASPAWQGLRASFAVDRLSSTFAMYTDGEARMSGRFDLGQGFSVFGEGVHFPRGSLYAKDMIRGRAGMNYSGPFASARAHVTDSGNTSIGACLPVNKAFSVVLGADAVVSSLEAVTLGVKFAPCHHFQLSVSDCMHVNGGSHRQTASLFAEPRKASMIGVLAAIGGRQAPEVAIGFETSVKAHAQMSSFKIRSFLDVMELSSRHELVLPFLGSSAAVGVELTRLEPRWTFRINVVS